MSINYYLRKGSSNLCNLQMSREIAIWICKALLSVHTWKDKSKSFECLWSSYLPKGKIFIATCLNRLHKEMHHKKGANRQERERQLQDFSEEVNSSLKLKNCTHSLVVHPLAYSVPTCRVFGKYKTLWVITCEHSRSRSYRT